LKKFSFTSLLYLYMGSLITSKPLAPAVGSLL